MAYLQCYPEMTRLWGKFPTIDASLGGNALGGIEHPLASRLMDFKNKKRILFNIFNYLI